MIRTSTFVRWTGHRVIGIYTTIMASHSIHISIARSPPQPTRSLAPHSFYSLLHSQTRVCAGSFHRLRRFVPSFAHIVGTQLTRLDRLLNVNAPLHGRSSCRLHLVCIPSATVGKCLSEKTYLERERCSSILIALISSVMVFFPYFIIRFLGLGDVNGMYYVYYVSSQIIKYLLLLIKLRYLLKVMDFKLYIFFYNIIFSIFYIFLII